MSTDSKDKPSMKATLGLTGLTMNAMALIAPGAFLWLTYVQQAQYGAPMAGCAMWFGILVALLLCFATAISYAELSKLYPGAGSSYFFAEQAFLSKTHAYKFARLSKFVIGWASHLYYWVYPGVMVGVTAILVGYLASQVMPQYFNGAVNSPTLMIVFCVLFSLGVAYIAYRGVTGTTGVNIAINVIQITALMIFSVIAIGFRLNHPEGVPAIHLSNGTAVNYAVDSETVKDDKGKPVQDSWADGSPKTDDKGQPVYKTQDRKITKEDLYPKAKIQLPEGMGEGDPYPVLKKDAKGELVLEKGKAVAEPFLISYKTDAITGKAGDAKDPQTFNFHESALSVVSPHGFSFMIVQACVAILILVGFESVTSMGEEAKNAKRDIPRAVLLSLFIQGVVCYLIEYFAAGFFMNSGYTMPTAAGSSAPIGDMMLITGTWLFHSPTAGWYFMFIEAITVFLALIGTTLSCLSTGARVTYAMGRDDEVPSHFGMLHGKTLSPHKAIWTLAWVSVAIGIFTVLFYLCGPAATDALDGALGDIAKLPGHDFWYPSFLLFSKNTAAGIPNSLLIVTLVSNFGTFLLYMLTCLITMVAFYEHHDFHGVKHTVVPMFGVIANFACMLFYLVGPFFVAGMSPKEPYVALGIAAVWGVYGLIYFGMSSKKKGKTVFVQKPEAAAAS